MKKRDYPLFMIDRSKSDSYPNDYITCLDREVGFVAKVIFTEKTDLFRALVDGLQKTEDSEAFYISLPFKQGGIVLHAVDFLYYFELTTETKSRIKVLLKKALKKYLRAEADRTLSRDDLSISNQIKQMELTLERAIQNYDDLVSRSAGDSRNADFQIDLLRATIQTLNQAREMSAFFSTVSLRMDPNEKES